MKTPEQMVEQPEAAVEGLAQPMQPAANPFAERLKKAYPDKEFASDDDVNAALMEHLDGLEGYKGTTESLHQKLADVLDAEPVIAAIINDVSRGSTFIEALSRNVDIDELKPVEGDPDYETWAKNLEQRKSSKSEREAKTKAMQENIDMSISEIQAFAEENGMSNTDASKFLETVDQLVSEIVDGKLTRATLAKLKKALDYDMDVQTAMQAGEVKGRNQKIEAMRATNVERGDGLPAIASSGNMEDKPSKPIPPKDPWAEAVEVDKKRTKLK